MAKSSAKARSKSKQAHESDSAKKKSNKTSNKTIFDPQNMILRFLANTKNQENKDCIVGLIKYNNLSPCYHTWASFCPPDSVLDDILKRFDIHSDAPLELPFFITMLLISSILIKRGVVCNIMNNKIIMSIWVVTLSESGSSKTLSLNRLEELFNKCSQKDLTWKTTAKSSLKFIQEFAGEVKDGKVIQEPMNNRLLIVDEATDWFKKIKNDNSPMRDIYDDLLKAHSHEEIGHSSKSSGTYSVETPAISMLCLATPGRFIEQISEADLEGGNFFRFIHYIAKDNNRLEYVQDGAMLEGLEHKLDNLVQSIEHNEYFVSDEAFKYGKEIFEDMKTSKDNLNELPKSYIKRVAWYMHKFALLYHIMLGHGNNQNIGIDAYQWASRLINVFNDTASSIIKEKMGSEAQEKLARVERLIKRRAEDGKTTTPRDIVINTKLTTQEARQYLEISSSMSETKSKARSEVSKRVVGGCPEW